MVKKSNDDCYRPWEELVKLLPPKKSFRGAPSYLPPAGLFGLMFLKHYSGMSDEKHIDAFNTNYAYQVFVVSSTLYTPSGIRPLFAW